jgi:hypothetical protein
VAADALQRQVHGLLRSDRLADLGLIVQVRVKKQKRYGDQAPFPYSPLPSPPVQI